MWEGLRQRPLGYCRVGTGRLSIGSPSHSEIGAQWKIRKDAKTDLHHRLDLGLQLQRPLVQMRILRFLFFSQRGSRDILRSGDYRFPLLLFPHHQYGHLTFFPGYVTLQQVRVEQLLLPANHDAVVAWSHSFFRAVWSPPRGMVPSTPFQLVLLSWE